MIDFTLLGTAATMPLPDRALSAAVLRCAGRTILFDCGEGTQTAARKAHVSLMKTDLIALTHYHGDHIFGLPGLMQSMNCLGRTEPLYITGPDGIEDGLAPILALAGDLQYEVHLITGDVQMSSLNASWPETATLTHFPTEHRISSCGYAFSLPRPPKFLVDKAMALAIPQKFWNRLQNGETVTSGDAVFSPDMVAGKARRGLRIVFSGDTAPCDNLLLAAKDADLLVCDATYGESEQADLARTYGHSTFEQTARLAAKANVRRLWLTHYSQMIADPNDYFQSARDFFPDAECGYDGKSVKLIFEE